MDLTEPHRRAMARSLLEAPTVLENLLWGWLLGLSAFDLYAQELMITDLSGDGECPDDFPGAL